jgi:hypothetical protein
VLAGGPPRTRTGDWRLRGWAIAQPLTFSVAKFGGSDLLQIRPLGVRIPDVRPIRDSGRLGAPRPETRQWHARARHSRPSSPRPTIVVRAWAPRLRIANRRLRKCSKSMAPGEIGPCVIEST